jgi:hypothetical protein
MLRAVRPPRLLRLVPLALLAASTCGANGGCFSTIVGDLPPEGSGGAGGASSASSGGASSSSDAASSASSSSSDASSSSASSSGSGGSPACGSLWGHAYGDGWSYSEISLSTNPSGEVAFGGVLMLGSIDFGGGPLACAGESDGFVGKLDCDGNHVWSRRLGDAAEQHVTAVAIDGAGNLYAAGRMYGAVDFGAGPVIGGGGGFFSAFLVKYDPAGQPLYSKLFGSGWANGIAIDAQDNVVITGYTIGTVDFGGGSVSATNGFVAKLDPGGAPLWVRGWDGAIGHAVAVGPSGEVAVTGALNCDAPGDVDLGGGVLPEQGLFDVFVVKYDALGNHVWSRSYGGPDFDQGDAIAVDGAGDVIFATYFYYESGPIDFGGGPLDPPLAVVKLDALGNHVWSLGHAPNLDAGHATAMAVDAAGTTYVAVNFIGDHWNFHGCGAISPDPNAETLAVIGLDPAGNVVACRRSGPGAPGDHDAVYGMGLGGAGTLVVGGSFIGSIDFGSGGVQSASQQGGDALDSFIVKIQP